MGKNAPSLLSNNPFVKPALMEYLSAFFRISMLRHTLVGEIEAVQAQFPLRCPARGINSCPWYRHPKPPPLGVGSLTSFILLITLKINLLTIE